MMKTMDHRAYPKQLKTKSSDSLKYIIADCQKAIAAMPDNENNGYYADEINYCSMELHSRQLKDKS